MNTAIMLWNTKNITQRRDDKMPCLWCTDLFKGKTADQSLVKPLVRKLEVWSSVTLY